MPLLKRKGTFVKKEVLLLRPLDYRGETISVERETDNGLHCAKVDGFKRMFFKFGPGWSFPDGTKFIGVEGTPLTAHPSLEGVQIPVSDFLKEIWPKGTYEQLNEDLRRDVESDYGIICGIKAAMPDEKMNLDSIKADQILLESDIQHMEEFGKSKPKVDRVKNLMQTLMPLALGFFLGIVVQMKGWF